MFVKYYTCKPHRFFFNLHPELTDHWKTYLRNLPDDSNCQCCVFDQVKLRETYFLALGLRKRGIGIDTISALVKINPQTSPNFEFWNSLYNQRSLQDKEKLLKSSPSITQMCLNKASAVLSLGEEATSPSHSLNTSAFLQQRKTPTAVLYNSIFWEQLVICSLSHRCLMVIAFQNCPCRQPRGVKISHANNHRNHRLFH